MTQYEKITEFEIKIDKKTVFHLMDCYPNSPIYDEVEEEYASLEQTVLNTIEPAAYIKRGYVSEKTAQISEGALDEGTEVIFTLFTIGAKISELSSELFDSGDYLAGMLVDTMADSCLFYISDFTMKQIRESCIIKGAKIVKRMEAPENIPMQIQGEILEEIKQEEPLEIGVTTGYMFTDVKTLGNILVLSEDEGEMIKEHNCEFCSSTTCKMRHYDSPVITLLGRGTPYKFPCKKGKTLMQAMWDHGVYFCADCSGKGICGSCKVKVLEGYLPETQEDIRFFTKEELDEGYRLSCRAYPDSNCTVHLEKSDESDFEVVTGKTEIDMSNIDLKGDYAIAIDLGTTTIAMSLIDMKECTIAGTYTTINKQRAYGSDVISRIQASNDGKNELLKNTVTTVLEEGITKIINDSVVRDDQVREIAIAGNTTMGHLLMGYSCKSLGEYPFTPVNISTIETMLKNKSTTLLPGISTYVGGDIVSGLFAYNFDKNEKVNILIDLGTNGELAIGNKDKLLVASTAAGPAFEGGNISCGVGGVSGAIYEVDIENDEILIETIGEKDPVGICGTGVVELVAELLKYEIIDETGLFDDDYFDDGFEVARDKEGNSIILTQQDVRELQLAKSAIRAGVETLLYHYGISSDDVEKVYLAGGFGYKMNIEKAVYIGLLPEEFKTKIVAVGNSSLDGSIKYICEADSKERIDYIIKSAEEISLSTDKVFNDSYVDNMMFSGGIL